MFTGLIEVKCPCPTKNTISMGFSVAEISPRSGTQIFRRLVYLSGTSYMFTEKIICFLLVKVKIIGMSILQIPLKLKFWDGLWSQYALDQAFSALLNFPFFCRKTVYQLQGGKGQQRGFQTALSSAQQCQSSHLTTSLSAITATIQKLVCPIALRCGDHIWTSSFYKSKSEVLTNFYN